MKLLTDRSTEIPMFLLRKPNGSFMYPGAPVPLITAAVTISEMPVGRWPRCEADERARRQLLREQANTVAAKREAAATEKKEEREAEKIRMSANFRASREVFLDHFKWGF